MTSASPVSHNTNNSKSNSAGSHSATISSTGPISFASAVAGVKSATTPAAKNTSAPQIVGAHNASHAPVNNRATNMAAPTIVNSNLPNGDHTKNRPSVTISAAGASGQFPNGGPGSAGAKPNINFGGFGDSTASDGNNVPFQSQTNSLPPAQNNPRILSPAVSPTPIPQPAASGGRPPSGFQPAQVNAISFGSTGGADNGSNAAPGSSQLRRLSSQASHPDANASAMPFNQQQRGQNFMPRPQQNRGPGSYNNQNFNQAAPYSPAQGFRPMNNQRPNGNMAPQFQPQSPMMQPNSPHMQQRTPGPPGNQMQYNGYMGPNQMPHLQPPYQNYQQQMQQHNGQFGQQLPYDPNYNYYQSQYQMHPHYMQGQNMQQGQPQSPRFKPGAPAYSPAAGHYNPQPSSMSRSPSQNPDQLRPASVVPPQPSPAASQGPAQTPAPQSKTPSSNNFTLPPKKSKGIVIKRPDGEVLDIKEFTPAPKSTPAPPAAAPSPAPSTAVNAPTPPPPARAPSVAPTESKPTKTAQEIKAQFEAAVKKSAQDDEAAARSSSDADAKAAKEKSEAEAKEKKTAEDKASADAQKQTEAAEKKASDEKAASDKAAAEKKAAADKEAADKEAADKEAADKAESEKVAAKKAEDDKAASDKAAEAEKATAAKATADKKEEAEKAALAAEAKPVDDEAEKKRLEDEEMERMIAEMEAAEKEEEDRQKAYEEKKAKAKAEAAAKAKATEDEDLKRAEREAEALEEAREKKRSEDGGKDGAEETAEEKAEREKIFASLKKPTLGPGADAAAANPAEEHEAPAAKETAAPKSKPGLKVETKPEPATSTPGQTSLRTARMLDLVKEKIKYPEGIKAPEASTIEGGKLAGRRYDIAFLLQFRPIFKEKPLVDWDQRVKDTMGDGDSKSARTPMTGRGPSQRGAPPPAFQGMGNFSQGPRTLPTGTTSAERFAAASGRGAPTMNNPLAALAGRPGGFPMGGPSGGGRGASTMNQATSGSRGGMSQRGPSRNSRQPTRGENASQNKTMPLTAGMDLKPIEVTASGWKPTSIGNKASAVAVPDGHMAPDMVQRKVKAALNKMTPERFDKISEQILEIAGQSRDETDGRTLRQVIQLTFDKACDEAHWAGMYAKFCLRMMDQMSAEVKDETVLNKEGQPVTGGALFRKYLLNRCQEEFERGWTVNLPDKKEGETDEVAMMSDEYYVAAAAKRKGLGLLQFIGEVYKLRMLSIKIMHQCFVRLFENMQGGMPDEGAIESLVKLLKTVGASMNEADPGPQLLEGYFQQIKTFVDLPGLPSRMHFLLVDVTDLRKAGWHSKDDAKGPKTIQEIREEAARAQEATDRERLASKGNRPQAGRGDARYGGGMPAPEYPRNQVASDDLRRLGNRRQASQAGGPARTLGPSSFSSRSNSGRPGMGPGSSLLSESRNSSKRQEDKKEDTPNKSAVNAFDALASLDTETGESPNTSPTLTKAQPAASTASTDAPPATESSAQEATGDADAAPADVAQANE